MSQTQRVTHETQEATDAVKARKKLFQDLGSGHATQAEHDQWASQLAQSHSAAESGPQAGLDAADAIAKGRTIAANLFGQRGRQSQEQMAEIHGVLNQITNQPG
jgi:hypothetical protein